MFNNQQVFSIVLASFQKKVDDANLLRELNLALQALDERSGVAGNWQEPSEIR